MTFAALFGFIPAAYASTTITLDSAGCASIGGTFSGSTCFITTAATAGAGDTWIVPSGDTLAVTGTGPGHYGSVSGSTFYVELFAPGSFELATFLSGAFSTSSGSIGTCPTTIVSLYDMPYVGTGSSFYSSSVSCSISGVPEFPIASLSSLLLIALLLPALFLMGRKFRAVRSPIV